MDDRVRVCRKEGDEVGTSVADDAGVCDKPALRLDGGFHRGRGDVLPRCGDQQLLRPADDADVAVRVDLRTIPGAQPAVVGERLRGPYCIAAVSRHDTGPPRLQLSVGGDSEFEPAHGLSDSPDPVGAGRVDGGDRGRLRHPPHLHQRHADGDKEAQQLRRARCGPYLGPAHRVQPQEAAQRREVVPLGRPHCLLHRLRDLRTSLEDVDPLDSDADRRGQFRLHRSHLVDPGLQLLPDPRWAEECGRPHGDRGLQDLRSHGDACHRCSHHHRGVVRVGAFGDVRSR